MTERGKRRTTAELPSRLRETCWTRGFPLKRNYRSFDSEFPFEEKLTTDRSYGHVRSRKRRKDIASMRTSRSESERKRGEKVRKMKKEKNAKRDV